MWCLDISIYTCNGLALVITLYPFLNVLAISLNESVDAMRGGIHIIPRKFTLDNYREIFKYSNLTHAFLISVLRTVIGTPLSTVSTCMLAYALSRKEFIYRKFLRWYLSSPCTYRAVDTGLHESEAPGAYRKVLGVYIARPDKYLQYDNSQIVHR